LTEDTIVWPKEGEQWGAPNSEAEDQFVDILPMQDTEWYQKDLFGLKTADEAGKLYHEEFASDHLRFEFTDFDVWIRKHF
jgi:palmitoyl-protein thioesterase